MGKQLRYLPNIYRQTVHKNYFIGGDLEENAKLSLLTGSLTINSDLLCRRGAVSEAGTAWSLFLEVALTLSQSQINNMDSPIEMH